MGLAKGVSTPLKRKFGGTFLPGSDAQIIVRALETSLARYSVSEYSEGGKGYFAKG